MKNPSYILLFLCAGCQLQEYRTTVVSKHIFSQEDSAFYFSDVNIETRSDSFELVRIGNDMKFYNAPNLATSDKDQIRLLYDRALSWTLFDFISA